MCWCVCVYVCVCTSAVFRFPNSVCCVFMTDICLSCFSLNVRGARNLTKRKALFLFCSQQKKDVYFLQETHSTSKDETFWRSQWGGKAFFSHGTNLSGGILVLFHPKFNAEVIHSEVSDTGRWIILVIKCDDRIFILVNVYGFNVRNSNITLLNLLAEQILQDMHKFPSASVIVGGDFNEAPNLGIDRFPARGNQDNLNPIIYNFCGKLSLLDALRIVHPQDTQLFTWFKADLSQKSRIDLWLISDHLAPWVQDCNISPAPLTDHAGIVLSLSNTSSTQHNKPGYWKLNTIYLQHSAYCLGIQKIITKFNAMPELSPSLKWELFKYECQRFSKHFGKQYSKDQNKAYSDILKELNDILHVPAPSTEDNARLHILRENLDQLFQTKAKGAFIRSRARWLEHGEKNSSYFFNLEKKRAELKKISALYVDNNLSKDDKVISVFISKFYQKLYMSSFDPQASRIFFEIVSPFIPKISRENSEFCESPITLQEIQKTVSKMPGNKSPGPDGLPYEFYTTFWEDIKHMLLEAFVDCSQNKEMTTSMKQGLISLIPKPNKDRLYLDNWRPITLLNSDYKILAALYANRLKLCLEEVISATQSGFMKGRHISNNIRLVLDILDYKDLFDEKALILFLDFYKAFDTVEHSFIFEALRHFGFKDNFRDMVKTLYTRTNSCVSMAHGTSPRFDVNRGIRQGCPISPFLFLIAAELLNLLIVKCVQVEGIRIGDNSLTISQLADDTCLFLQDDTQVPIVLQALNMFSRASGLTINKNKCEILTVHESDLVSIEGIKVKKEVKYLGITLSKSTSERISQNFHPKIENSKSIFNCWLQRDLSIFGRILLSKAEGLSRLVYPALSLYVDHKTCAAIDSLLFKFIWKHKTENIKRKALIRQFSEGGLNVLDFQTINRIFKVNWLKHCLTHMNTPWFFIPNFLFDKCGGLKFLLSCNFTSGKLPVKLANFHKQALDTWKIAFKHNFSPHSCILWNNQHILYKNKTIFIREWYYQGIIFAYELLNNDGNLATYEEFTQRKGIALSQLMHSRLLHSLPASLLSLLKAAILYYPLSGSIPALWLGGKLLQDPACNNSHIRSVFTASHSQCPTAFHRWRQTYPDITIDLWSECNKFFVPSKTKEVHIKVLHRYYPSNEFINKFRPDVSSLCSFCQTEVESLSHLFYSCSFSINFWKSVASLVWKTFLYRITITENMVLFLHVDCKNNEVNNSIKLLCLMGKFHIHKARFLQAVPQEKIFYVELKSFYDVVSLISKNKKAIKTSALVEKLITHITR